MAGDRALVLLHGFMGRGEDWAGISARLSGVRVVAPDLPGHGASTALADPEQYTMEEAGRRVMGELDLLGLGRVVLAGYSMGGRLALYLALRHQERFSGLFLESATPGMEDAGERALRRASDERLARRLESGDLEDFLREWYAQPLFSSLASNRRLLESTIAAKMENDPVELGRSLRGMGTGRMPPMWGGTGNLRMPVLAVAGESDQKYAQIAHRIGEMAPDGAAVTVVGAGHNVHAERPGEYARLLGGFIEGL